MLMLPTWNNKRLEEAFISKRLDGALVKVNLVDSWGIPRSVVITSDISDHMPIKLMWNEMQKERGRNFKFNRVWLEDQAYTNMVKSMWVNAGVENIPGG